MACLLLWEGLSLLFRHWEWLLRAAETMLSSAGHAFEVNPACLAETAVCHAFPFAVLALVAACLPTVGPRVRKLAYRVAVRMAKWTFAEGTWIAREAFRVLGRLVVWVIR